MTNWSRVGVVALTAAMLAGCSSTRSTTVQSTSGSPATPTSTAVERASAHAAEAPIGEVPWSQVGAGWMLAMWSPVRAIGAGAEPAPGEPTPQTSATTLYLVSPEGGRYAITTFPPPGDGSTPALVDCRATAAAPCSTTERAQTAR